VPQLACPDCSASALRLVYVVVDLVDRLGYGAFWCDACLQGISLSRAEAPAGAAVALFGETAGVSIPDYAVVSPQVSGSAGVAPETGLAWPEV